jgi:hypothetical protein
VRQGFAKAARESSRTGWKARRKSGVTTDDPAGLPRPYLTYPAHPFCSMMVRLFKTCAVHKFC